MHEMAEKGEALTGEALDTLYADITHLLHAHGIGDTVLDVGCGQGELLEWHVVHLGVGRRKSLMRGSAADVAEVHDEV